MREVVSLLDVRVGDLNYGGHLGHDRLITLLHQARCDFLTTFNASETDCFGVGLIMRRITVDYLAEVFLGDSLKIIMCITGIKGTRFILNYRVLCKDKVVATAETVMVAFDYVKHQVVALPSELITILSVHG